MNTATLWRGRCPACSAGSVFDGWLRRAPSCTACGEDFSAYGKGDGAVFLVMSLLCLLLGIGAVIAQMRYGWPLWMHAVIWPVVGTALSLLLLRPAHGLMIAWQYQVRPHDDES